MGRSLNIVPPAQIRAGSLQQQNKGYWGERIALWKAGNNLLHCTMSKLPKLQPTALVLPQMSKVIMPRLGHSVALHNAQREFWGCKVKDVVKVKGDQDGSVILPTFNEMSQSSVDASRFDRPTLDQSHDLL